MQVRARFGSRYGWALVLASLAFGRSAGAAADDLSELLARHALWRGGSAFQHLQTVRLEGTVATAGLSGTVTAIATSAGQSYEHLDLGAIKQTQAVGTDSGWMITASGQVESLSADAAEDARRESALDFAGVLDPSSHVATLSLHADESVDGARWRVVHIDFGGHDGYDLFLDDATGAQHGYRKVQDNQTTFVRQSQWHWVNGVRMPFLVETVGPSAAENMTVAITQVRINEAPPGDWLERPAQRGGVQIANDAARSAWMPLELTATGHIFMAATVNGVATRVLLDSGAASTVIDAQLASAAHLQPVGAVAAKGTGGGATVAIAGHVTIGLGDVSLNDLTVAVLPMRALSEQAGEKIEVILGKELLNELVVDLDFEGRRVAFAQPGKFEAPPGATALVLARNKDGLRTVDVRIEDGQAVPALFDLGNSKALTLHRPYWEPLQLERTHRASVLVVGGVGGLQVVPEIVVKSLKIGGFELAQVPTDLASERQSAMNSDRTMANVGLEVWRRFRLVTDYRSDRIYLLPSATAPAQPFQKDRSGLALERTRRNLTVRAVAQNSPAARGGWRTGDHIARIDGRSALDPELKAWAYSPAGTVVSLRGTSAHGKAFDRSLTLEDFY